MILLTGFLGAGKTTLLLRWLQDSPMTGLRMGVVMNEFGAESVDSQLIQRPGLPLRQVAGGCICCASDNELDRACTLLSKSGDCDYLVIESSGLADPDNIIDLLTDQDLLPLVQLQAVVTVIDAPWYVQSDADPGERVLARKQIQFAHVLCLSKCDRLSAEDIAFVVAEMARLNPDAQTVKLPYDLPIMGEILRRPPADIEIPTDPNTATDEALASPHLHTAYQSLTFRFPVPVERSKFEAFLARLNGREVVRAKGFVRFVHSPEKLHVFQSVWGHHLIEEFLAQPHPAPVAVLIGPNLEVAKYQIALRQLCFRNSGVQGVASV